MLGWRSSGFSPKPSAGPTGTVLNGEAVSSIRPPKKMAKPSSTAVAYGATSRSRPRRVATQREAPADMRSSQSSSDPSCEDHMEASR